MLSISKTFAAYSSMCAKIYRPLATQYTPIANFSNHADLHFLHYPSLKASSNLNIIAIHCFLLTAASQEDVLNCSQIRERASVYNLELRNHGKSPQKETMDFDHQVLDIMNLIEKKNLGKNNVLFGHSYGGMLAYHFMKRYPDYSKAGILLDVAPFFNYASDPEFQIGQKNWEAISQLMELDLNRDLGAIEKDVEAMFKLPNATKAIMESIAKHPNSEGYMWTMNLELFKKDFLKNMTVGFDPKQVSEPLDIPIKVIGTSSKYIRDWMLPEFKHLFKRFEVERDFVRLKGKHFITLDTPELVTTEIVKFLDQMK